MNNFKQQFSAKILAFQVCKYEQYAFYVLDLPQVLPSVSFAICFSTAKDFATRCTIQKSCQIVASLAFYGLGRFEKNIKR